MNERTFNDTTFNLALKRARAAEAECIKRALAGNGQKPSVDLFKSLGDQATDRTRNALAHWYV